MCREKLKESKRKAWMHVYQVGRDDGKHRGGNGADGRGLRGKGKVGVGAGREHLGRERARAGTWERQGGLKMFLEIKLFPTKSL